MKKTYSIEISTKDEVVIYESSVRLGVMIELELSVGFVAVEYSSKESVF